MGFWHSHQYDRLNVPSPGKHVDKIMGKMMLTGIIQFRVPLPNREKNAPPLAKNRTDRHLLTILAHTKNPQNAEMP